MTKRNRRRDLKEWFKAQPAPTRAAVLGALILGVFGLSCAAGEPATDPLATRAAASPTVTLTPAPQAAATGALAPSVPSIYGTVFHDWNGNGKQDAIEAPAEPALPGIRVCLDDSGSGLCAVSAESGHFVIEEVPPGDHTLWVESDRYSYLFPSVDAAVALEMEDVPVTVDGRTLVNIGLGEGPLTLPFLCGEMGQVVGVSDHFDRDPRPGPVRDWMGQLLPKDGYTATTFKVQGEVTVVASAPGVVNYFGPDAGRYLVELQCDAAVPWFPANRPLWLYYYGLDEVSVEQGDTVARGQTLGRVTEVRSEISLRAKYTDGYGSYIFVDLFRDTQTVESRGLWTRDNDPVCFYYP